MMSESNDSLPDDLPGCHSMIRMLQLRVKTLRGIVVGLMGYDPTEPSAMEFARSFSEAMQRVDPAVIEAELAAEDAMRRQKKPRKKK